MQKVFLDCGTNTGQGLAHFNQMYKFNREWEIVLFEPNPHLRGTIESIITNNSQLNIHFVDRAVTAHHNTNKLKFSMEKTPENPEAPIGGASTLMSLNDFKTEELEGFECVEVESVRLSDVIYRIMYQHGGFQNGSNVFHKGKCMIACKLDVEGEEYNIIQDLIDTGAAWAITDLHVEFHSRRFKDPEAKKKEEIRLVGELFQRGVNLFPHF